MAALTAGVPCGDQCSDAGLDTTKESGLPKLTRNSYILARSAVADPADGASSSRQQQHQAGFTLEVARVQTFFSSEPPGADAEEKLQYFAEVAWLSAPIMPAAARQRHASGQQEYYPRCARSGLPIVFTNHYRTHGSVADGFITAVWPLVAMMPVACFLAPLDELHDVPGDLLAPSDDCVEPPVNPNGLLKYGCDGRDGYVPGAAGDPYVRESWGVRLAQRQASKRRRRGGGRPAARERQGNSDDGETSSDSGSEGEAGGNSLATPLLSTVIIPYRKLYLNFL